MGTFMISLDCEGKWGMADHITAHHNEFLTTPRLEAAYGKLLDLFQRTEIPVTFAFVMALTMSADEVAAQSEFFHDIPIDGRNWLFHFRRAQQTGNLDGWSAPRALDLVRANPQHEIACHGFCHLPLAESLVSADVAAAELASARRIAKMKGLSPETFVYPRNQIGHAQILPDAGYRGYRLRPRTLADRFGKPGALLEEMNVFRSAQDKLGENGKLTPIPSGYFFNWRRGARKIVPPAITVRRWRRMIGDAVANDRVVHLWLHPHNIIDAPETLPVLANIVLYAAGLRRAGDLKVVTMRDYCLMSERDFARVG